MATIAQCLLRSSVLATSDSPQLDVQLLLAHVTGKDRSYFYAWPEAQLSAEQLASFERLLARREQGEPIAHILGQRDFWSFSLSVDATTLIPRPDTELLVETVLGLDLPANSQLLDMGTGTGAIALALASERIDWQVVATDVATECVALAQRNGAALDLDNIRFLLSDWYSALAGQRFDVIVSNPPYIAADDKHLNEGDVRFEPRRALVALDNGLADLRHIISQAPAYLCPGGWLLLEHGYDQGTAVQAMLTEAGFCAVDCRRDLAANDRVSLGQWPGEKD
ncbi:MAG: peptide chain release factor N(5)-glutamine methyltransferase [Pseudomonadales bacterium]